MRPARHFTAAAIVVDDDRRVLLVHHNKIGVWIYPGGHLAEQEDPVEAAVREVREETGIRVRVVDRQPFVHPAARTIPSPFAILEIDMKTAALEVHHHVEMIYVCRPDEGTLRPQLSEVSACRWFSEAEVEHLDTPPELPALVTAALDWLGTRNEE
ncbi:NUDIX domain-containing protein [Micromonospora taraxaci]|uniref:ADP-ribose pyrophosphatase YjhB (NUDIX family) n=1 Tax=Micromonospora taraxaci TaxID=1316803 RepID=A0A561W4X0_9ACTN|nr:NUDIX domain-containing protein [Micromonospora taraxaci]TWG18898.1 ADP-ribose pyrophosphatase YjhB (NUDIX family) [Micromonospora taraxaci]